MNKKLIIGLGPNSKLVREYKQSLISLNTEQWEASIGLMLGDASLQTQNNGKNYRLKFEWSDKTKSYPSNQLKLWDPYEWEGFIYKKK